MTEEKKEPWLNYLALTTIIFAICATLSTFKAGSYSTRSVLNQSLASNQWAYYQSKRIKQYLYQAQKDAWELDLKIIEPKNSFVINDYRQKIGEYTKKIATYNQEATEIQQNANNLEQARDEAKKHSQTFSIGVIYLQISILLSSISALLKQKILWYLGIGLGTLGIIYFIDGFFLFI